MWEMQTWRCSNLINIGTTSIICNNFLSFTFHYYLQSFSTLSFDHVNCFKLTFFVILRAKEKLNEEATRYLQEFPEEKIFHTSNLHLLEMVGQGKMCEHVSM